MKTTTATHEEHENLIQNHIVRTQIPKNLAQKTSCRAAFFCSLSKGIVFFFL